tara:strand:+ start:1212 stop:2213 length:1002 start_codon:yes stop_codon:yes gene_type:complete
MKKIKFLLLILPFFFLHCEKVNIEGPSLNDIYGELDILQPFKIIGDSADFSTGNNIYFTASFSKQVDWRIRIQGDSSGSVKIISGKSNEINQYNSLWNGSSTHLPFFIAEDCNVELTFEMHDDTIYNNLTINKEREYNNGNSVLISDYENGFNPNFTGFFQAGCTKQFTIGGAGQGIKYLQQYGTCSWDWLIGYIDYHSTFWFDQQELVNDPNEVYFNIMIKGDSTISSVTNLANSLFKLEFYEDENGDGYYDANTEDRYDYEFDVDWNGWRMISICYNDVEKLVLATSGGDAVRNPTMISNVRTLLLANPESGFAKADVDFLIWSIGSPILN